MSFLRKTPVSAHRWLVAGLLLMGSRLMAQDDHSYKMLGWVSTDVPVLTTLSQATGHAGMAALTPRALLGDDEPALAAISQFAARYPGRESIVFTNELLTIFEHSKADTEGFHLFFGLNDRGQFQPMIVHTDIDRAKVSELPNRGTDQKFYRADFRKAYFWNNATRRWTEVLDQGSNLKVKILTNRTRFRHATKGYYLSKDLLVDAWKRAGKQPLTAFFQLENKAGKSFVHLRVPCHASKPTSPVLTVSRQATATTLQIPVLHTDGPSRFKHHHTSHLTVRPCPSYCGDDENSR